MREITERRLELTAWGRNFVESMKKDTFEAEKAARPPLEIAGGANGSRWMAKD